MIKNLKVVFIFTLLFLLFLKIDYRITNDLNCCGDDYDYYSHSLTIALDKDFDYSNQGLEKMRYFRNSKEAPFGFVGTGILSAPFLLIGNIMDKSFSNVDSLLTYQKLIYSFSSIFYFLMSYILFEKILNILMIKFYNFKLVFFGSGLIYYSFERYSMTPSYEVFTITLLIYLTIIYYKKNKSYVIYFIPFSILLCILVRWTNIYIIFIPGILISIFNLTQQPIYKFYLNIKFLTSTFLSLLIFIKLSYEIYGVLTFSPSYVYMQESFVQNIKTDLINNFLNNFFDFFNDIFIILLTKEFGLLWFSPIIFIGFASTIISLFTSKKEKLIAKIFILLIFLQNFYIVSIWDSTASSYGFRYLYSLIPLSILCFSFNNLNKLKILNIYFYLFSLFSIISSLFFESSIQTQLSLEPVLNSFGSFKIYSQPNYLEGVLKTLFIPDAYFKVLGTSFLVASFLKIGTNFIDNETVLVFLSYLNINENSDVLNLLSKIELISLDKFLTVLIFAVISSKLFSKSYDE